jgi:HSP20 family protein
MVKKMSDDEDWNKKRKKRRDRWDPFDLIDNIREMMEDMMKEMGGRPFDIEDFEKILPKFRLPSGFEKKGPYIFGFSMGVGPDGKPIIREFGNKPGFDFKRGPKIKEEREPLVDIMDTKEEVIIVAETPGIEKEEINLRGTEKELEIKAGEKFYKKLRLPVEVIPGQAKANYKNGVLEVRIPRLKPNVDDEDSGTEIQVE